MKSGTKAKSSPSLKMSWKQFLAFLLKDVGARQDWPKIDQQEMEVFSLLEQSGLPFADNVELSFAQRNEIRKLLNEGVPFARIISYQKGARMKRLAALLENFSLPIAIDYDQRLQKSREVMTKKLFSHSVYPLFIMAFATGLVWFFSCSILPAFDQYQSSDSALLDGLKLFTSVFWILLGGFAIFLGSLFVGPDLGRTNRNPMFAIGLVRMICSIESAALLECTQSSQLSTMQTLAFMEKKASFPFASVIARKWSSALKNGCSLFDCIQKDKRLDPAFIRFFEVGLNGSAMEQMMQAYQQRALTVLERKMKKLSNWVLYLAYGSVGLLAISVYQIMLAPLSMLNSF